jgi:hypothetical protein
MKKLLFIPVILALVAPLAACTSTNSTIANAQTEKTQASPVHGTKKSSAKTPVASLTKNWYHYTAKDGSYSAKFPKRPKELVKSGLAQVMYEDVANNRAYLTQNNKFTANPSELNVEKALDAAVASQTQDSSTVSDEKKIELNGLPGREITVRNKKGMAMKARMFIESKEPTLYIVMVAAGNGKLTFPEAQAFLDSLSIPKK